jgi:tetratricopeptide (TPR) repeat protein
VRGFVGLQTIKLAQGKHDQAIQAMQDLVQKNPNNIMLRYQLAGFETAGGAQEAKTNPDRAKQLFQQAADNYKAILKTSANSADVWLRLGALQRQLGQNDAALASFEQAANADPHSAEAFLNKGMLLDYMGKKKEAADAYNRTLGIDPQNTLALNNLAMMNAEENTNLDQAMTYAERAKSRVPNSPDISDTLGFVYYQKNLNSEALRIFKQNVQDYPKNPIFRLHLAMALLKQGDKQAARDEAEKALKESSQPTDQEKIRSFVSRIG